MTDLRALVDQQLASMRKVQFCADPVLDSYAPLASILSSVPKRHGRLIEAAINHALTNNDDYRIWIEKKFVVPIAADHAAMSQGPDEISLTRLPYGGAGRPLQIDLMAYSRSRRRLGAYEIKRANGWSDSTKLRSVRRDLFGVQMALASYGVTHSLVVDEAVSRIIFYYGKASLPPPWSLVNRELDQHFGCEVWSVVEAMTEYFRSRLHDFLEGIDDLRPELRQMVLSL